MIRGILASVVVSGLLVAAWAACLPSEPAFDASEQLVDRDAGTDAPHVGDASNGCDLDAPFLSQPQKILTASSNDHRGAHLFDGELAIYYGVTQASEASGNAYMFPARIVLARRDAGDLAFDEPKPLDTINRHHAQDYPTVTPEGTGIVFAAMDAGQSTPYLAFAPRTSDTTFGPSKPLPAPVNNGDITLSPFLHTAADGVRWLWFSRIRSDIDAGSELYRVEVKDLDAGVFGVPQPMTDLNTEKNERAPVLSDDDLEIFFVRNGTLSTARRANPSEPFRNARPVSELEPPELLIRYDAPSWLSPDRCRLYYHSERQVPNSAGDVHELYMAKRPPKP